MIRATLVISLVIAVSCFAQQPASVPDGTLHEKAEATYKSGDMAGAIPLFEEMVKRHPDSPLFTERLAFSLYSVSVSNSDAAEGKLQYERAKEFADKASKLGDTSQLEQGLLESLKSPYQPIASDTPAHALVASAERDFSKGDLDAAMAKYEQAYALDPKLYSAALYAGDVQFREGNDEEAGKWFARAIAIDPDRETAYRYWGDALEKAGKPNQAVQKYVAGVVAEPYKQGSLNGLINWAKANNHRLSRPSITLPQGPQTSTKDGKPDATILINPTASKDDMMAAIVYSGSRLNYQREKFAKEHSAENVYRHSLAEEAEAIRSTLEGLNGTKIRSPIQVGFCWQNWTRKVYLKRGFFLESRTRESRKITMRIATHTGTYLSVMFGNT